MQQKTKHVREPLFHIVKRDAIPKWQSVMIRVIAVALALLVNGIVILAVTGENPINLYITMFDGAIGTSRRFWGLMQNIAILLCLSLAVTPAFSMRFWNIGA